MTVISSDAARASGRFYALRKCLKEGSVVEVLPGIYAASSVQHHPKVRLAAASMWSQPDGALTGIAAAHVWGIVERAPSRVTVAMPRALHRRRPTWLRTRRLEESFDPIDVNGRRVVDPENAVIQAWNELGPVEGSAIVVEGVRCKRTTAARVSAVMRGRVKVRARRELEALLALLAHGVTSYLEYIARTRVFTDERFPGLVWQRPAEAERRERFIDIFDTEAQLGIELDSKKYHGDDRDRRADLVRANELSTIGVHLLHFTFEDIVERPEWCIEIYLKARAARLEQLGRASGHLV